MKTNVLINAHDSLFLKTKHNELWSQGEKKNPKVLMKFLNQHAFSIFLNKVER